VETSAEKCFGHDAVKGPWSGRGFTMMRVGLVLVMVQFAASTVLAEPQFPRLRVIGHFLTIGLRRANIALSRVQPQDRSLRRLRPRYVGL
jgi:hypothetical protein